VKLTTHLHLVPRLRMSGTLPQLPFSIRGVQKDSCTLTFTFRHVNCQTQHSVLAERTGLDIVSGQLHTDCKWQGVSLISARAEPRVWTAKCIATFFCTVKQK